MDSTSITHQLTGHSKKMKGMGGAYQTYVIASASAVSSPTLHYSSQRSRGTRMSYPPNSRISNRALAHNVSHRVGLLLEMVSGPFRLWNDSARFGDRDSHNDNALGVSWLVCDLRSQRRGDRFLELLYSFNFNLFGYRNLCGERLPCFLFLFLNSLYFNVFSSFSLVSEDYLLQGGGTPVS